jgi:potassium efflux system protein
VRIYVPDVNSSLSTQTEVRKAIVQKFRQQGVEIPFPQQDLHLRDLDFVKSTVARMAAERAAKGAKPTQPAGQNGGAENGAADAAKGHTLKTS